MILITLGTFLRPNHRINGKNNNAINIEKINGININDNILVNKILKELL